MRKRGAPLVPSPELYAPSRNDGRNDDPCLLCGDPLAPWSAQWCELVGPLERATGFAHARCVHEYRLFEARLPFVATLFTPCP